MRSRFVASATLFALTSALAACAGEVEPATPGATETPYALGSPDLRIAVVGAGPSGLTAAHELEARGYQNVTVFEKSDHVGGKVNTIDLLGRKVELGAVFASPDYTLTLGLADQYGVPYAAFETPRFVYDAGVKRTYADYLTQHYTIPQIQAAVQNYATVLQTFPQIFADGLDNLPDDLKLNFSEFAVKYHIEPVADMAKSLIVGFGYGYYTTVPAIYELKILNMLVKIGPTGLESPPYFSFPTGYQSLWEAVAADLDVRLNSNVTSIKRSSGNGPIKLKVNGVQEYEFDAVIVSAPLSAVPGFVKLSPAEEALFHQVETSRYFITLFLAAGATQGEAVFIQDNANVEQLNRPSVWANPGGGVPIFQAYTIAKPNAWTATVTALLAFDIAKMAHGLFVGPLLQKEWPDYFPRVNSAAMMAGFYDQVEALQGNKGLYYVGGTLSFETVETSARYARSLVDARFPATAIVTGP
jgi:oxygen-dependent protoporphyrinogen oxidase